MHGTFDKPESIILKESDYIEYDHTHPLISTFIKGILVNHSFLFVGYSLNDYNLRLIMGWINYYRKQYNSKSEKVKHFVVNTEKVSDYEVKRLSDNNIEVIDLTSMSDDAKNDSEAKEKLSGEKGRLLYTYLSCIEDDIKFEKYCEVKDFFLNKCEVLKSYRKINIGDFKAVLNLGCTYVKRTDLVFEERGKFDKISELLNIKNKEVIDIFQKTKIRRLVSKDVLDNSFKDTIKEIPETESKYSVIVNGHKLPINKAFRLYLENDYIDLRAYSEETKDLDEKIYYRTILGDWIDELQEDIDKREKDIKKSDYVSIMLHKVRAYLSAYSRSSESAQKKQEIEKLFDRAPMKYKIALQALNNIFKMSPMDKVDMAKLFEKHEGRYKYVNYAGVSLDCIEKLQGYAYDYYFFFKENLLPLDIYTDAKDYLKYYLKVILSSYSPNAGEKNTKFWGITINNNTEPYLLNEIDLDMLVKFMSTKDLKSSISDNNIKSIFLEKSIDVVKKYENLCNSLIVQEKSVIRIVSGIPQISTANLQEKFYNFSILVCLFNIENNLKAEILKNCFEVFKTKILNYGEEEIGIFEPLAYLINNLKVDDAELMGDILDFLVKNYELISKRFFNLLSKTIFKLAPHAKPFTVDRIKGIIEDCKTNEKRITQIYSFRYLLPKGEYRCYLYENVNIINNIKMLFDFTVGGYIEYKDKIMEIMAKSIGKEIEKEKESGVKSIPFNSRIKIEYAVLLKIIFPQADISILKPYAEYSPYLKFMLAPKDFDYSEVDLSDYMWDNLTKSKLYQKYFIENKEKIWSDTFKDIFKLKDIEEN